MIYSMAASRQSPCVPTYLSLGSHPAAGVGGSIPIDVRATSAKVQAAWASLEAPDGPWDGSRRRSLGLGDLHDTRHQAPRKRRRAARGVFCNVARTKFWPQTKQLLALAPDFDARPALLGQYRGCGWASGMRPLLASLSKLSCARGSHMLAVSLEERDEVDVPIGSWSIS